MARQARFPRRRQSASASAPGWESGAASQWRRDEPGARFLFCSKNAAGLDRFISKDSSFLKKRLPAGGRTPNSAFDSGHEGGLPE
jgi:hypothetical protein